MNDETKSGEWQTDENGKRYRMIGRIKEYEMTVLTSHGTVTQSQLEAINRHETGKTAFEQVKPIKACPFKDGLHTGCDGEACALYVDGCALASGRPQRDTAGRKCPFGRSFCGSLCALYNGGCTLTATKN
ncbi:MAG: hypothetical protein IJG50_07550 [Clostridia bacterium]|nr:hypothetical protein [Clostridia bacterium]